MRGKGLGKMLVNARIDFAKAESTTKNVRVRVLVHPNNSKTVGPLTARGFEEIGKCCGIEAIPASGDGMLLPADGGVSNPEVFFDPHVFVLELETSRE